MKSLYTRKEAAEKIKLSERTVMKYLNKFNIPYIRTASGTVRITEESLEKLIECLNNPPAEKTDVSTKPTLEPEPADKDKLAGPNSFANTFK